VNLGHGERGVFVADAGRALPDIDQAVFVTVDERLEEDAAHQCENGSVTPMPSARVRITVIANPGVRKSE